MSLVRNMIAKSIAQENTIEELEKEIATNDEEGGEDLCLMSVATPSARSP